MYLWKAQKHAQYNHRHWEGGKGEGHIPEMGLVIKETGNGTHVPWKQKGEPARLGKGRRKVVGGK